MPLNGGAIGGHWSTPSHSRWECDDADWEDQLASGDPWGSGDPWSGGASGGGGSEELRARPPGPGGFSSEFDGWMTDSQIRNFTTARVPQTTAVVNGRWSGSYDEKVNGAGGRWHEGQDCREGWNASDPKGKPTEKLVVPSFDGEATTEGDVGRTARSYLRKVQAWLRCTKMPAAQRALALYNELTGRAWVYAEELDVTSWLPTMACLTT